MFIKIILSILFIGLSLLIYYTDKRKPIINIIVFVVLSIFTFIIYKLYESELFSKTALIFILIYSMSLILLIFIMKGASLVLRNRYDKLDKNGFIEKYKKVTEFLKREAIIILITIYQLLIIWNPSILGSINI